MPICNPSVDRSNFLGFVFPGQKSDLAGIANVVFHVPAAELALSFYTEDLVANATRKNADAPSRSDREVHGNGRNFIAAMNAEHKRVVWERFSGN